MSLQSVLKKKGPRKLLALDGGGIRGMISLEVLAELEKKLSQKVPAAKRKKFVLADYFDYIAGTSTGAIIAAALSRGMKVADIKKFYIDCGPHMFKKAFILKRLRFKYQDEPLAIKLKEVVGARTDFGFKSHKDYRSLLMVVLRNATTDSPWPLSNNPNAKYNDATRADCNTRIPLWQVVRASTAAPTYFPPEEIQLGNNEFIFVDGGVTMFNNPAWALFLMATLKPYKLEWPTGEKNMLIVSIGTGYSEEANEGLDPEDMNLLYNAGSIPSALMFAALQHQDMNCRVFGKSLVGDSIDGEIGHMLGDPAPGGTGKLFTYLRYNADISQKGLKKMGLPKVKAEKVAQLDSIEAIPDLQKVGRKVATRVDLKHFDDFPA